MKRCLLLLGWALPLLAVAQPCDSTQRCKAEGAAPLNRYTTRSLMLGVGGVNRLETYLSPLEYKGTEVRFLHESMRMTKWQGGRVSTQQFFEGNFSYSKSPTADGKYFAGDLGWHIGYHYHWQPAEGLRLLLGALGGAQAGFVYNTRNGNNPAQGKLLAEVALSASAIYRFVLWHRHITARYQFDMPLAGLMFSPAYGQSYYEIFDQHHYDHNVCATWPGNAPTFEQLLTFDVPIGPGTLRLGYRSSVRQSKVNHLKAHAWSNLFMIGFVRHFRLIKPGDKERVHFVY